MKQGDIVELISGGPHMTVEQSSEAQCNCIWFNEGELRKAKFNIATLKEVKQKSKK